MTLAASNGPQAADLRERPVAELLKQLANETTTLVRQELDLAKAEMREKAGKAGAGAGMWGAAGVIGLLGLGSLTAFLILALGRRHAELAGSPHRRHRVRGDRRVPLPPRQAARGRGRITSP